jgi:hypothetical protein
MESSDTYTVFEGSKIFCRGSLSDVILRVKRKQDKFPDSGFLIFSDRTGKSLDFNLSGTESDVQRRLEVYVPVVESKESGNGPGRPKLGVISREVSLLPRHWEWLANQPGGASATLRKLIEGEKKKSAPDSDPKSVQERTYRFMSVLGGDLEGYEEALRALYRKDKKSFQTNLSKWPTDVREHAYELAKPLFG